VTLPEATPVHEAAQLQGDLRRAGIEPFAWVINQSFAAAATSDPLLKVRAGREARYIGEVTRDLAEYAAIVPWMGGEHSSQAGLRRFIQPKGQEIEIR
jgi:arsenite-transporting ATPase